MSIRIGNTEQTRFYRGTTRGSAIYRGNTLIHLGIPAAPTIYSLTYVSVTTSTWGVIGCVTGWGDIRGYRIRWVATDNSSRPAESTFSSWIFKGTNCGTATSLFNGNTSGDWVHVEAQAQNASGWGFYRL